MDIVDLVAALAVGIGLGAITGMPLGVINVAIVDAAIARERAHARGLAIGGALADATHTLLAFLGLGRLVTARPEVTRYFAIAAAVVIVVFAIASWRRRRPSREASPSPDAPSARDASPSPDAPSARDATPSLETPSLEATSSRDAPSSLEATSSRDATSGLASASSRDTSLLRSVLSGIALTLPNPAALAAWVAVAAMIWPSASIGVAIAMALGVGIGSAAWFLALGRLVARVRPDHPTLRLVPQIALVAFVGIAVIGVVRAI